MVNKKNLTQDNKFNLLSSGSAFVMWGGWAYYINGGSISSRITSGITQGCASFTITLILIYVVTWIFHHLPKRTILLPLPAILVAFMTGSTLFIIHSLIQTPKIFYTILPSIIMSFGFCLFITIKLKRSDSNK